MFARATTFLTLAVLAVRGTVTPTSPDSTTVVQVGNDITALWDVDTTGTWTNLEIQLMTGPNLAMVPLATVATGIDGTSATSYSFAAPDVTPYSKIYFLQFTNGGDMTNVTWTTRFTIEGTDGSVSDPTNSTTTDGTTVQWGTGSLLSNVTTGSSNSTSSGSSSSAVSGSVSASASATSASASVAASSAVSSTSAAAAAASATSDSASASGASAGTSAAASAASAASSATTSSTTSAAGRLSVEMTAFTFGGVVVAGVAAMMML